VKDRLSAYIDAAKESAIVVTRNGKPGDPQWRRPAGGRRRAVV